MPNEFRGKHEIELMRTPVFVLHTPLFVLDIPETDSVVQTGSSEPFPVLREACSEDRTLL
jgi:hypothetical protein